MTTATKRIAGFVLALAVALNLTGCGGSDQPPPGALSGTITASGSTALLPLAMSAKDVFEAKHEYVTVNVSGGGSFNGLTQVAQGAVQIGNSDVEASGDQAAGLVDHKVAVAPFVIVAHRDVSVTDVTMDQLARIFKGEITNWKEVGGQDQKITVVSRQQSSGSRATVVATVLKGQGDITKTAIVQDSNGKVRDGVVGTPGAIGYIDAPYFDAARMKGLKVDGVAYSVDAVTSGKWPIYAYGHMYTKGEPTGLAKSFLDFVLGEEFQNNVVEQKGFIPVSKMKK